MNATIMNYQRIYDSICQRAKNELEQRSFNRQNKLQYYESHHIIPKCLGGHGKYAQWEHPNIVLLTAKEHFICHRLLCAIYLNNRRLLGALMLMSTPNNKYKYKVSSRVYSDIRTAYASVLNGVSREPHIKKKISDKLKGKKTGPPSEATRKKLSLAMIGKNKGKTFSREVIEKRNATLKRIRELNPQYGRSEKNALMLKEVSKKRIVCPHCNKEIQYTTRNRYHFDNCKEHPDNPKSIIKKCPYCNYNGTELEIEIHLQKCQSTLNPNKKIIKCDRCGKEGTSVSNMKRYHFDNCKHEK